MSDEREQEIVCRLDHNVMRFLRRSKLTLVVVVKNLDIRSLLRVCLELKIIGVSKANFEFELFAWRTSAGYDSLDGGGE